MCINDKNLYDFYGRSVGPDLATSILKWKDFSPKVECAITLPEKYICLLCGTVHNTFREAANCCKGYTEIKAYKCKFCGWVSHHLGDIEDCCLDKRQKGFEG